jgi:hypothetical protein
MAADSVAEPLAIRWKRALVAALHDLVGPRDDVDGGDADVELLMIELVHRFLRPGAGTGTGTVADSLACRTTIQPLLPRLRRERGDC